MKVKLEILVDCECDASGQFRAPLVRSEGEGEGSETTIDLTFSETTVDYAPTGGGYDVDLPF